jgi:hypothetical protein
LDFIVGLKTSMVRASPYFLPYITSACRLSWAIPVDVANNPKVKEAKKHCMIRSIIKINPVKEE